MACSGVAIAVASLDPPSDDEQTMSTKTCTHKAGAGWAGGLSEGVLTTVPLYLLNDCFSRHDCGGVFFIGYISFFLAGRTNTE